MCCPSLSEHREHSEKKHRDKEKERVKHSDGSVDRHREKQKEKDKEKRREEKVCFLRTDQGYSTLTL